MNKQDLVNQIAAEANIPKAAAERALDVTTGSISGALAKGEAVMLIGFGTFDVGSRAARAGRNPQTGATIQIAASKVVRFKPGKALKDQVNK